MSSDNVSSSADTWAGRLDRFQTADMTVAQFCQVEGVSQAPYFHWRRKLRGPAKPSGQNPKARSATKAQPAEPAAAYASQYQAAHGTGVRPPLVSALRYVPTR